MVLFDMPHTISYFSYTSSMSLILYSFLDSVTYYFARGSGCKVL